MSTRIIPFLLLAVLLAGCSGGATGTSEALPTVVLGSGSSATEQLPPPLTNGAVSASGVVVAVRESRLAYGPGGRVAAVHVTVGDRVQAGQTLIEIDPAGLQASLAQAQAALDAAQAEYDLLAAGPTAEQLRQAEATVQEAQAHLDALQAGPRAEEVSKAEATLAGANAALAQLQRGPTDLEVQAAKLGVEQAQGALWAAQSSRDAICGSKSLAGAQCDAAQAEVLTAEAAVKLAQNQLAQLQAGASTEALTQAQAAVRIAQANLALAKQPATAYDIAAAQAGVDRAQAALDGLKAGPAAQQLAVAQAGIASARAQVQAAQATLDAATLQAPFAGSVAGVQTHVGEWAASGQILLRVVEETTLRVETTDLSERDLPGVALGQPVSVSVKALNQSVTGHVAAISPLADTLGGDVVYTTVIDLDELPEGLRAGMSVEIQFAR